MRTITTAGGLLLDSGFSIEVQRLIAKYGLAAHLTLLAVAPLVLYPFCGEQTSAEVLLWLSLLTALWTILEPSMRKGEGLSDSRRRVVGEMMLDPLFWILLVLVGFSGFRALNTGIALSYDAEISAWHVSEQTFPLLPGAVDGSAFLPFAVAVAFLVLLQACRHSLGRSARHFFLLASSALAGLAAVIDLVALRFCNFDGAVALLPSEDGLGCSFIGFAFGIYLIGGIVALVAVSEQDWDRAFGFVALAIGGTLAGTVVFAPFYISAALVVAALLVLVYSLVYSRKTFRSITLFKLVLIGLTSFVLGGLFVMVVLPENAFAARLSRFPAFSFFPEKFLTIREMLSAIAFKSWISHLWLGTGVASFPLDFRMYAQTADWDALPRGTATLANCWWLLLAERGVVGLMLFILPFGSLLYTYIRRAIGGLTILELPNPACIVAPVVLTLFVVAGFFDCSPLRADVLLVTGSLVAISAVSFPRVRRRKDG